MEQQTWPESASRSIVGDFYSILLELDSYGLNHLAIETYPKWARRVIDAERQRRPRNGPILAFSAYGLREKAVVQAHIPKEVDRSAPPEDAADEPKLPETASRSIIGIFYSNLLNLDLDALNCLSVTKYPAWARRTVEAEQQRRKQNGPAPPSKSQKAAILTIGETGTQKDIAVEAHTPKEVDESVPPKDVDESVTPKDVDESAPPEDANDEPDWPEVVNRSMIGSFYSKLLTQDQDDLY
ncbi:hypothetical protein BG011_001661, partial [Mortierella polycephala]